MGTLAEINTPVIPLPVPLVGSYVEGGPSIETLVPKPFKESLVLEIGANHALMAGYSHQNERTFEVQLIRDEVFGAVLIDYVTPPVLSTMFFEFDAYTQLACVDGLPSSVPLFGTAKSGADTAYTEEVGTATEYSE